MHFDCFFIPKIFIYSARSKTGVEPKCLPIMAKEGNVKFVENKNTVKGNDRQIQIMMDIKQKHYRLKMK